MREQAEQIILQLRELLECLEEVGSQPDLEDKRLRFNGVTKAIQQLESGHVPVPVELRKLKSDLSEEVGAASEAERVWAYLRNELTSLMGRLGTHPVRRRGQKQRSTHAATTHRGRLREMILESLRELGGRARSRDVLDLMASKLDGQLLPRDTATRRGGELVWRNNARFERFSMIQEGLLKSDSPQGLWELP